MVSNESIGVVTVTYNSAYVLDAFLRCMKVQTHDDFILYVVDNASNDQTLEIARNWADGRLRIIANTQNLGVAEGNNQGIRSAIADGCSAVLLINNDTEFPATLIEQLANGLDEHAVEMTCPKMMYFSEPSRIWAAGGTLQPWFGYRSVHLGENEIDHGQYDTTRLVTYVPTCCVLIHSDVFRRIGIMDKHYFVYADDTDFMYRAFKAGIRLMYLPEIQLLHKVGGLTGGELSPFSVRYTARNRTYFLLRHCGLLRALMLLVAYQLYFAASLILRRIDFKIYSIKERAVWEGIQLWRRRRMEVAAQCQL